LAQKIKTEVYTEKQAIEQGVPCGYCEHIVVSLALRISNNLYVDSKQHAEKYGYSSLAEYIKEAVREKIEKERILEAELMPPQ
jgi:hypothetical protein